MSKFGATIGAWTRDLILTMDALYQLSYRGILSLRTHSMHTYASYGATTALLHERRLCLCLANIPLQSLLILTYLPRSRQATSGGESSCWSSIRVLAGSALRMLPIVPRRYRLPSKLPRIRQQSSRTNGFAVHSGASGIQLKLAQWKLLLDKLAVICGADLFDSSNCSATA